ncbi:DUF1707 domain-containing protein [Actinomycetospora sp. TBRC 11914]|uniref:DUF1707 SHOCT-like domain-containing protein n=1 Tax=Actinomycetospora sp. TBRC 11914 TaxID=2729387 RepID=UPI00145F8C3C|nr:DUF1707 domain-containing protein [Actinomycetospora sp. TBRC 11914]NMO92121.1 DUF1707 domain-containing protein [Actinomycetospora sp. TBRC 11914]
MGAESGELRIGDRERRETDDRLRAAHDAGMITLVEYDERVKAAYAARFRSELAPLVADLPDGTAPPEPDDTPTTAAPAPAWHEDTRAPELHDRRRRGLRGGLLAAVVIAVVAIVAPGVATAGQGAAMFGSRTVQVAPGEPSVSVGVLFGSTKVVVPDGTHVTTSGTTVFGSTDCDTACAAVPAGAPQLQVSARGAFGSIQVQTASEAAADQARDDARDQPRHHHDD